MGSQPPLPYRNNRYIIIKKMSSKSGRVQPPLIYLSKIQGGFNIIPEKDN